MRKSAKPRLSIVTWLIIINVIVSVIGFFIIASSQKYLNYIALKPSNILQGDFLWTLLTHMFIHGSPIHLFVNMFVLFSLGSLAERIIGRKRFLWLYLSSGLFAGVLSVLMSGLFGNSPIGARIFGPPDVFMVGASGAIFAIAGLYVTLLPKLKFMIIFLPFFSLPAYLMVPLALFIMWIASAVADLSIGNVAHFGGFLIGILYGFYLRVKYKRKVKKLERYFR
jgi:membrane associated rhomboid family serine protease